MTDRANVAAACLLGLGLAWLCLAPAMSAEAVAWAGGAWPWRLLALIAGAVWLFLNGRLLAAAWRAGSLRERLRLAAPDGANLFAPEALEDLFLRVLKAEPDVSRPQAFLEIKAGAAVAAHLRFGLREQDDALARMEEVKALVRDRFLKMIPSGVALEVYVEVVEFMASPEAAAARKAGPEFTGPVYSDEEQAETGGR
jgi:hypothetical protein